MMVYRNTLFASAFYKRQKNRMNGWRPRI